MLKIEDAAIGANKRVPSDEKKNRSPT